MIAKKYLCIMVLLKDNEKFIKYLSEIDNKTSDIQLFYVDNADITISDTYDIYNSTWNKKDNKSKYCLISNSAELINNIINDNMQQEYFDTYIYYNNEDLTYGLSIKLINKNNIYYTDTSFINDNSLNTIKDSKIFAFDVDFAMQLLNSKKEIMSNLLYRFTTWNDIEICFNILRKIIIADGAEKNLCLKIYIENEISNYSLFTQIYFNSFLLSIWKEKRFVHNLILLLNDVSLTKKNRYFIYMQINYILFAKADLKDDLIQYNMKNIYRQIMEEYSRGITENIRWIPVDQRDKETVFVVSKQILDPLHSATKIALDYCYTLQKDMGKKVILINFAEKIKGKGMMPFFSTMDFNYINDFSSMKAYKYKNTEFSFMQLSENMPNKRGIITIIEFIKKIRPYCIISIGSSLTSDLCSKVVPVISVATVLTSVLITESQFTYIGRNLTDSEWRLLSKYEKNGDYVIEGRFTFEPKKLEHQYTRKEINLPEDKFIAAVIGNRLDYEIDDQFMDMLDSINSDRFYVVFIGKFNEYESYLNSYPRLNTYSKSHIYEKELGAYLRCCDLFINPKRNGGGTSAFEALYQGVPVVSFSYGDVAVHSGEEFCVDDYNEMSKVIMKHMNNIEFHNEKRRSAKQRSIVLCDMKNAVINLLNEVSKRKRFL